MAFTRFNVFLRDRFRCQYCGERFQASDLSFDHVVPRALGGTTCWQNIVAACRPCNTRKDKFTVIRPLTWPREPTPAELMAAKRLFPPNFLHDSWVDFLYWMSSSRHRGLHQRRRWGGAVEFRVEKAGIVQAEVGKAFAEDQLVENIKAFADAVAKAKPAGAKGTYIQKMSLSSTMGPGLKLAPSTIFSASSPSSAGRFHWVDCLYWDVEIEPC